jgi:hypothetical protein
VRRKRNGSAKPSVVECSFCGEAAHSTDRLLVSDRDNMVFICAHCVTVAAAKIAEARTQR